MRDWRGVETADMIDVGGELGPDWRAVGVIVVVQVLVLGLGYFDVGGTFALTPLALMTEVEGFV